MYELNNLASTFLFYMANDQIGNKWKNIYIYRIIFFWDKSQTREFPWKDLSISPISFEPLPPDSGKSTCIIMIKYQMKKLNCMLNKW